MMPSLLPDFSPRDSHSLWYTSSRNPFSSISNTHDVSHHEQGHNHHHGANGVHRRGTHLIDRSPLARLRADEQNIERRRQNVMDFGSGWLKPPGLPKTLHQLREERREAEEHQEALRREQLAQELAEAEAEAAGAMAGTGTGNIVGAEPGAMMDAAADGDEGMDDVQLDGARDLDDDIPEAEDADFGLSVDGDEDEESEEGDEHENDEHTDGEEREMRAAHAQQQQLMAQRMRNGENLARGRDSAAFYGADEEIDDEDQSQMIEEDDLVGGHGHGHDHGHADDMGMDADLDDEIPEAESMGGYEHTDTEAEVMSSIMVEEEDDTPNQSHVSFAAPQLPQSQRQAARFRHSFARSDVTRNSIGISDILSRDGSSYLDLDSSPVAPRQMLGGPSSRRGR